MNEQITVSLQKSNIGPTITLGCFSFVQTQSNHSKLEEEIKVSNGTVLKISGTFSNENGSANLAGFIGEEQVFLFTSEWNKMPVYLGLRLKDVGFLHIIFGRTNRKN